MSGPESPVRTNVAFLVLVVLCSGSWFVFDPPQRNHETRTNPARLEAQALRRGTLELPERFHDTALHEGRAYNVFQPGQTLFYLGHDLIGADLETTAPREIFALFVLTTFLLYGALLRLTHGRSGVSLALTISMMFGAPYFVNLRPAMDGAPWRLNHVFTVLFTVAALFTLARGTKTRDLLGAGLFIGAAMMFRLQSVLLLALPMMLMAQDPRPGRRVGSLLVFPVLALLVVLGFQAARFGTPFETGYMLIYEGRSDALALRAAEHGLMSWRFLPENLWRTFLAIPVPRFEEGAFAGLTLDGRGNSLLFSQPILLLGLLGLRTPRSARLSAFVVVAALTSMPVLLHHNPGWHAPGYMRMALDYLPIWIAATALALNTATAPWTSRTAVVLAGFALAYGWYLL